ncbi:autotransporter-associated beta strand protein [Kibdelosporangium banguiense]|uniref:Autotransporter-associated beta strand protein n=1 Tax=Kibdelosporangium banguiense TaxID=1365924 RepID=A0ABS4U1G8_9PSEU|nr:phosphatase PAP2 family protein [Kibdelosporangium banguiense]MBP2330481.1 autotransporter-associated beta strand protein [Kibdelosporangium banguiense]
MPTSIMINRRAVLRRSALLSVGLLVGPAAVQGLAAPDTTSPFVDWYRSNIVANQTPETNAAVRILSGMRQLWRTGPTWDTGVVLNQQVLRANMNHCARITRTRTDAEAKRAFIFDRQHQSYAMIGGLGPWAELYKAGAKAVTSITSAPDGTPPAKIDDAVPPGAPAGSALGAGSQDSQLGQVVRLVDTVRGPFASGNPSKFAHQYPRPWRMTPDSKVVPTGATDSLGYPVYRSEVKVAPQLLRQRSTTPAEDGGFPSGHTNAFHLAGLALAYAIPERFQELVVRALELSDTRIVSGMHSPLDVIGGRILATALAAATLADPQNAELKAAARAQAAKYFQDKPASGADPYADRKANAAIVASKLTYELPRNGSHAAMTVPKGAEVLLETRLPYLSAEQRREVLRTTALPAGYPVLDGPEQWGRLNLYAAADGYGAFDDRVRVFMDASRGGFHAADTWRNPIAGNGGLVKAGTGELTLAGSNRYRGGTRIEDGTLTVASPTALGNGDVELRGGTLRLAEECAQVQGTYRQAYGTTLAVTLDAWYRPALTVSRSVTIDQGVTLEITIDPSHCGAFLPVLATPSLRGRFSSIKLLTAGFRAVPVYLPTGLSIRLVPIR